MFYKLTDSAHSVTPRPLTLLTYGLLSSTLTVNVSVLLPLPGECKLRDPVWKHSFLHQLMSLNTQIPAPGVALFWEVVEVFQGGASLGEVS